LELQQSVAAPGGSPSCFTALLGGLKKHPARATAGRPRSAQITRLEQVFALLCTLVTLMVICIPDTLERQSVQSAQKMART
jgi:hypothetical protein